MTATSRRVALALLLAALKVGPAHADEPAGDAAPGRNCLGEPRTRLLLVEGLYLMTAPLGVENQLQAGVCTPLVRRPGELFDFSNAQAGALLYLSPVYAMPGVFASVAPLSILELRMDAQGVAVWPIGLDAAGYFPLPGPGAPIDVLPASQAVSATGVTVTFTGTLQAEVEIAKGWTVAAVDSLAYGYWRLGNAAYYYNPRFDLDMARSDWVGRNMAVLVAGHPLSGSVKLQAGVTDELTWVASAGSRQNILAGLVAAVFPHWPGPRSETSAFLRVGGYTDHPFRTGELQILGGVSATFDVGGGGSSPPR